jgi:hypothetical protein|tara:strand:+ start:3839 stop:4000 length:162 start_codon:yes stop_codon:yes gene_type:complete
MQYDTKVLILQLLREEKKRADHIATLFYKKEVEDAMADFLHFLNKNPKVVKTS